MCYLCKLIVLDVNEVNKWSDIDGIHLKTDFFG